MLKLQGISRSKGFPPPRLDLVRTSEWLAALAVRSIPNPSSASNQHIYVLSHFLIRNELDSRHVVCKASHERVAEIVPEGPIAVELTASKSSRAAYLGIDSLGSACWARPLGTLDGIRSEPVRDKHVEIGLCSNVELCRRDSDTNA